MSPKRALSGLAVAVSLTAAVLGTALPAGTAMAGASLNGATHVKVSPNGASLN